MEPQTHRIETLSLDCGFTDESLAWEQQSRLEDFMRGPAQAVIAEVFERNSGPDEVWSIDVLELDLGFLGARDSDEDWAARLANRLEEGLARLRGPAGLPGGEGPRSHLQHGLEAFAHYQSQGTLPWSLRLDSHTDFSVWIKRMTEAFDPTAQETGAPMAEDPALRRPQEAPIGPDRPGLLAELNLLMREFDRTADPALRLRLGSLLQSPEACAQWLQSSNEAQRWGLLMAYLPATGADLRRWSEQRLGDNATWPEEAAPTQRRQAHWRFILSHVFVRAAPIAAADLDAGHARYMAAEFGLRDVPPRGSGAPPNPAGSPPGGPATQSKAGGDADPIWVANAGLVILGPYLPRLFERLKLTQDRRFVDGAAQERGVQCLEFLARPGAQSSDPGQALSKLLCGVPLLRALPPAKDPDPETKAVLEGLLQAVISNWTVLGNTSVAGLRTSFLQREGRLFLRDDGEDGAWNLRVEARAYDMLMDRLPWSIALQRFPWTQGVIHVEWR